MQMRAILDLERLYDRQSCGKKYGNRMWHWTDYCEIYESDVKKKEIQEVTKWMEKDYTGQKKTE